MTLRKLLPADVDAYRALKAAVIHAHPVAFTISLDEQRTAPDTQLLADIAPARKGFVMGAFEDDALIGVAGLRSEPRKQAAHRATLFGMAVHPARARKGIGRALVEAVAAEASSQDFLQLVLTFSEGNTAAEQLYRACGFVVFGREPRAVIVGGVDVTKIYMLRRLDASPPG